ncbi:hypothetical protein MRB53_037846 [Persea americana]|nr:hypothetical protein MRB53_037846 [Persea americana]
MLLQNHRAKFIDFLNRALYGDNGGHLEDEVLQLSLQVRPYSDHIYQFLLMQQISVDGHQHDPGRLWMAESDMSDHALSLAMIIAYAARTNADIEYKARSIEVSHLL